MRGEPTPAVSRRYSRRSRGRTEQRLHNRHHLCPGLLLRSELTAPSRGDRVIARLAQDHKIESSAEKLRPVWFSIWHTNGDNGTPLLFQMERRRSYDGRATRGDHAGGARVEGAQLHARNG